MANGEKGPWKRMLLLGASVLTFSVAFPPFNDAAAVDPSVHMVEHVLILISGAVVAFSLINGKLIPRVSGRIGVVVGLFSTSSILIFWHLPGPWDSAVLNPAPHIAEHISIFVAGMLVSICLLRVSDVTKVLLLVLGVFAHTAYATVLTSGSLVYQVYSLSQQQAYGLFVFATDPLFLGLIMWVIWRADRAPVLHSDAGSPSLFRKGAPLILAVVIMSMVSGFYIRSALAISASGPPTGTEVVVFIQETPVSWQYSPQSLTVVVGLNNTVTWLSHSLSYDTVTSDGGTFSSGALDPGESYSYTFTSPGTYEYHCLFHPWMLGSVTVLPTK